MKKQIQVEEPFSETLLLNKLQSSFPEYQVKKIPLGSGLQVRPSNFTTRGVVIKKKGSNNTIELNSNYSMIVLYSLFCWPLGLYMYINRKKHKDLFSEVSAVVDQSLKAI